ncbi:MAG: PSD1 and planctomycete cytochrome C domain-containing protein, partial [Verrucomicrobia subdivision 3 bacterium]|nr:PSD1 and planctomycete cytochrome C domain-containing protein [Limisphaerales bacterium]
MHREIPSRVLVRGDSTIQRFNDSTVQRFNDSTIQRFNGSTIQRLSCSTLLIFGLLSAPCAQRKIDFNRDIRPILSDNCFACHGFDQNKRKAKLRLDIAEGAYATRDNGVPVVPGKPDESLLIERVTATDTDDLMPPPKSGKRLTLEQINLLRNWIRQGGAYQGHWAFRVPVRPELPVVRDTAWGSNPVDAFILARLEQEKLAPASQADQRTLIRRVTLDLTGLPPEPDAVERFVRDRDPRAFEKLVRRLLDSERFGERMAVHWLDLVRYADTVGFHGDMPVSVWAYRDYVIRAFNSNMAFDRFTREQLAGDLLPNATREQRIASGYNRINRMSTEGGIQDKEYRAKYAADRVRTTSGVWLGATMGCAECHDHKYDPFLTRDFYQFAAFFADLREKGFYEDGTTKGDWGPAIPLPTERQQRELDRLDDLLAKLRARRDSVQDASLSSSRQKWEESILALDKSNRLEWTNQVILSAQSQAGADLIIESNEIVHAQGLNPDNDTYIVIVKPGPGEFTGLRLETLTDETLPGNRIARGGTTFILTDIEIRSSDRYRPITILRASDDTDDPGFPVRSTFDRRPNTGWGTRNGGSKRHYAAYVFAEPLRATVDTRITLTLRHDSPVRRATIGKFKLALTSLPGPTHDKFGLPEDVLKAIREPPEKRSPEQQKKINSFYRRIAPELGEINEEIAGAETRRSLVIGAIPTTIVSEATTPRVMRVLPRGDWMNDSGSVVEPAAPHFLPQIEPAAGRATRLDLAAWLTSPENPLTARVVVNRFWKLFFGAGLCRTLDDFGAQGDTPSHPDLLDWLAVEFRDNGWNVKHIIELIVTSATYRQSSTDATAAEERDPQNRLFARQSRLRLEAEFIRDNALAIGGLLVNKVGGPSVFPYQPEGYWAPLNFPKREYVLDCEDNLHRRGVYMHWQRTFLHPSLVAFDAPPREECTAIRPVSNTPLQALVLLNDPNFVEAAEA